MDPFKYLLCAERRLTDGLHIFRQSRKGKIRKADFLCCHIHQKFTSVLSFLRNNDSFFAFQYADKEPVRAGFVREEHGSIFPGFHSGQVNFRVYRMEIRVIL